MTYEYTPVLHVGEDLIFFLPLQHPAVIKQGHVFHIENADLMAIGTAGYDELKDELALPELIVNDSRDFIVNRMMALDFEDEDKLTSTGFGYMYQCFAEAGQKIEEMLTTIPEDLPNWVEATMEELVLNFGIDTDGMDDNDIYMAVLGHIESVEAFCLIATYDADGKDWILYNITSEDE